jgi:hypothetical protein
MEFGSSIARQRKHADFIAVNFPGPHDSIATETPVCGAGVKRRNEIIGDSDDRGNVLLHSHKANKRTLYHLKNLPYIAKLRVDSHIF